ncbi:MAG: DUF2177 family protein [Calditrichaeota bacterium]|nr:MAG: DUF2177 family protein [Calditrichota bacterium]
MLKNLGVGTLAVFVLWEVLDFVLHGIVLAGLYSQTGSLMRPPEEVKMILLVAVVFISAFAFTYIYVRFVQPHTVQRAIQYGLMFGVAVGVGMGYGTYATQPIPYMLALGWFLGTIIEAVLAGLLLGLIIRD